MFSGLSFIYYHLIWSQFEGEIETVFNLVSQCFTYVINITLLHLTLLMNSLTHFLCCVSSSLKVATKSMLLLLLFLYGMLL